MKLTKFTLFTLLFLSFATIPTAQAGVLVEPMIGYQFGDGDEPGVDHSYSGPFFGGRLGYQQLGFMLGLDYRISTFEDEQQLSNSVVHDDQKQTKFGAFVGFNFPILMRAWVSYYFDVSMEDDDARNNNAGDEYSGDGLGAGIGFTGLPFVSVNIEYHAYSYDEFENARTGAKSSVSDFDVSEILLSVSLPLDF